MRRRLTYETAVAFGTARRRPKTLRCIRCKAKITVSPRGRLPRYCSHTCRQRTYERHKWEQPHLIALGKDLITIRLIAAAEAAVNNVLEGLGITPPPPKRPKPNLRVVQKDEE